MDVIPPSFRGLCLTDDLHARCERLRGFCFVAILNPSAVSSSTRAQVQCTTPDFRLQRNKAKAKTKIN